MVSTPRIRTAISKAKKPVNKTRVISVACIALFAVAGTSNIYQSTRTTKSVTTQPTTPFQAVWQAQDNAINWFNSAALTAAITVNTTTSSKADGHPVFCDALSTTLAGSSSVSHHVCRWSVVGPVGAEIAGFGLLTTDPRPGRTQGDVVDLYTDMEGWTFVFFPEGDGDYTITLTVEDTVSGTTDTATATYTHSAQSMTEVTFGTGGDYTDLDAAIVGVKGASSTTDNHIFRAVSNTSKANQRFNGNGNFIIDGGGYEMDVGSDDIDLRDMSTSVENVLIKDIVFTNTGANGKQIIAFVNSTSYEDFAVVGCSNTSSGFTLKSLVELTQGPGSRIAVVKNNFPNLITRYICGTFGDRGGTSHTVCIGNVTGGSIQERPFRSVASTQVYAYNKLLPDDPLDPGKPQIRPQFGDHVSIFNNYLLSTVTNTPSEMIIVGQDPNGTDEIKGVRISRNYHDSVSGFVSLPNDDGTCDDVSVVSNYATCNSRIIETGIRTADTVGDVYCYFNTFVQRNNASQFVDYRYSGDIVCKGNIFILGYEGQTAETFTEWLNADNTSTHDFGDNIIPPASRHLGDRIGIIDSVYKTQAQWTSTVSSTDNFVDLSLSDLKAGDLFPEGDAAVTFTSDVSGEDLYGSSITLSDSNTLVGAVQSDGADTPTITANDVSGAPSEAVTLDITAALTDTGGSETLSVEIDNVPATATFSAGTDNADGTWTFTSAQLSGLTFTYDTAGDVTMTATATATETETGDTATASDSFTVTLASPTVTLQRTPLRRDRRRFR